MESELDVSRRVSQVSGIRSNVPSNGSVESCVQAQLQEIANERARAASAEREVAVLRARLAEREDSDGCAAELQAELNVMSRTCGFTMTTKTRDTQCCMLLANCACQLPLTRRT